MTETARPGPFIDLEFDTETRGGAQLGDIAASLVSLDELLRDLASIASSDVEFRRIEIVAIEMRHPLKIRLSLFGIPTEAVRAFQDICRDVMRAREAAPLTIGETALNEKEGARIRSLIVALQNAAVPLKRVEVKNPG